MQIIYSGTRLCSQKLLHTAAIAASFTHTVTHISLLIAPVIYSLKLVLGATYTHSEAQIITPVGPKSRANNTHFGATKASFYAQIRGK